MTAPKDSNDATLRAKGMQYAQKTIEKMFEKSEIQDKSSEYPKFSVSEVKLGKVLGRGGFGTVSEVRAFDVSQDANKKRAHEATSASATASAAALSLARSPMRQSVRFMFQKSDGNDTSLAPGQMESRKFISENCIRHGGDARYALKILSPDVIAHTGKFIQGVMDMAIETRFLSDIEHPNIVKLRATANCEPYNEHYFIVMDRLYDTLEKRILAWAQQNKRHNGIGRLLGGKKKAEELFTQRIVAAFDLASAVEYLHERKIIYRDLKPENIGFDIRGDIKIFDFGLAKELGNLEKNEDGTYKLTGMTGSPRYMAPEVGLEQPYNATCDSYSFSILLWEILALRTPYELYTIKTLKSKVWQGGKRPPVMEKWPAALKLCLKKAWTHNVKSRSSMGQIAGALRNECIRCQGGDDTGLEHNRRRSTFVYRPPQEK